MLVWARRRVGCPDVLDLCCVFRMEGCCVSVVAFSFNAVGVLFRRLGCVAVLDVRFGLNERFFYSS